MSDCDEREQELECLESIYAEAYELDEATGVFSVRIQAEEDSDDRLARQQVQYDIPALTNFGLVIHFTHPSDYPEKPIKYNLEHVLCLDHEEEEDEEAHISKEKLPDPFWFTDLKSHIDETIEENLGDAHAFQVCSEIQEKITELCEKLNEERSDKIAQIREEEEQAHTKKLIGTPVTLESFTEWKIKFQAEMKSLLEKKQTQFERDMEGRPTGKVIFLNKIGKLEEDLDVGDLVDEKDKVEYDENLFEDEDLGDLDAELEGLDEELEALECE